jgi:phage terminase large subunit
MMAAHDAGRLCRLPIEPQIKVDTAWDIGIDDATAIWFVQEVGRERRLIDYLEVSGEGLAQIAKRLDARNYRYGRHVMPHDADARERGSGQSYRRQFEALGFRNVEIVRRTADLVGDINATRLAIARCWFDAGRCARGIEALKQYRREWDGKRQTWRERPLHDWTSHGADAFRALALSRAPQRERATRLEIPDFGIV